MKNIEIALVKATDDELLELAKEITLIQDPIKQATEILNILRHAQEMQKISEGWTRWYEELTHELYGSSMKNPDLIN